MESELKNNANVIFKNTMKIAIVSDSHDNGGKLEIAVEHAKILGAQAVFHCGDVTHGDTLRKLERFNLELHVVHGNNANEPAMLADLAGKWPELLHYYGDEARFKLCERSIYISHYPTRAQLAAVSGGFDLACCGHAHKPSIGQVKNAAGSSTWLVNPGTVGAIGASATYLLGDLEKLSFEICFP